MHAQHCSLQRKYLQSVNATFYSLKNLQIFNNPSSQSGICYLESWCNRKHFSQTMPMILPRNSSIRIGKLYIYHTFNLFWIQNATLTLKCPDHFTLNINQHLSFILWLYNLTAERWESNLSALVIFLRNNIPCKDWLVRKTVMQLIQSQYLCYQISYISKCLKKLFNYVLS